MAGLGSALMGTSAMAAPTAPAGPTAMPTVAAPPEADQGLEDGAPASEEEQELYDKFVSGGMEILWDETFVPQFKEMLADGDPVSAIGTVVSQISGRLVKKAMEDGVKLPGDVVMHGSLEVTEQAGELAERLGSPVDEPALEEAYYSAIQRLGPMLDAEGISDPEGEEEDQQVLAGMEQDGRLDQLLETIRNSQTVVGPGRSALEEAI